MLIYSKSLKSAYYGTAGSSSPLQACNLICIVSLTILSYSEPLFKQAGTVLSLY